VKESIKDIQPLIWRRNQISWAIPGALSYGWFRI